MRAPAETYLKKARIAMSVPEATHFKNDKGLLVGQNAEGKQDFFFFNATEKPNLKKHFPKIQQKSEQVYFNKGGFKNMKLYKGMTNDGDEFQAYHFQHPKTKKHHVLFLKDARLSKQPAKVRALVDSMRAI